MSALYGVDYRWTSAYGYQSGQLATNNQLNGFDDPEFFGMLYEPHLFKGGSVIELGRVISVPDIEAQLAPQNYEYAHSIMFDFDNAYEAYYLYTRNASAGGTISNGPPAYASGGGPGTFLPGASEALGIVDYLEYPFSPTDFTSFRTDYLNDPRGWRTGYASSFGSLTLGVTHHFSPLTWIRPEIRLEKNFAKGVDAYDNLEGASNDTGTKDYQRSLGIDLIQWF